MPWKVDFSCEIYHRSLLFSFTFSECAILNVGRVFPREQQLFTSVGSFRPAEAVR